MRTRRDGAGREVARLDEPRLSVAPLIDVCFLLLIFFVVTTTIKSKETDVTTNLTTPSVSAPVAMPIVIEIRAGGEILLNPGAGELLVSSDSAERDLPRLEEHLETVRVGLREDPVVMVKVESDATHQRVVDVMNVLRKVGLQQVGFVDEE